MQGKKIQRLLDLLFYRFEREGTSLFALLDAARDPNVLKAVIQSGFEYQCLFAGRLDPALQAASPYIVRLLPDLPVCERLAEQAWGQAWGLFLAARGELYEVRRHLRTLLRVQTQDRKYLLFRYYDPRVLRSFLPTCDVKQLRELFGPIERFDIEAADSSRLLRFRLVSDQKSPSTLRSWTYPLHDADNAPDDRGTS
jgi:hypothetical protein